MKDSFTGTITKASEQNRPRTNEALSYPQRETAVPLTSSSVPQQNDNVVTPPGSHSQQLEAPSNAMPRAAQLNNDTLPAATTYSAPQQNNTTPDEMFNTAHQHYHNDDHLTPHKYQSAVAKFIDLCVDGQEEFVNGGWQVLNQWKSLSCCKSS